MSPSTRPRKLPKLKRSKPTIRRDRRVPLKIQDLLEKGEGSIGNKVKTAGRIISQRKMGKTSFIHIQDLSGKIQVYLNNDMRANIKSKINKILGSNIREVKQYVNY